MSTQKDETKILLDADVVIHFMKAGQHLILKNIFPGRLVLLDKVKAELVVRHGKRLPVANFLEWSKIPVEKMPEDKETLREYAMLRLTRDEGESACMAVAKHHRKYIASSNLKDIREYCIEHSINYYTTMDILEAAMVMGILTEAQCNQFIIEVKSKNSKLPCNTMAEFLITKKTLK